MKKSKKETVKKAIIFALYPVMWTLCITYFWYNRDYVDAMGYALIVIWFLIPFATLVSSFFIGFKNYLGKLKFVLPVFYGVMHMLTGTLTFDLANTLHSGNINTPEWTMLPLCMMISALGLAIGWALCRTPE